MLNESSIAKPSNLKGSNSSHMIGYKISKAKAKGQQNTNRIQNNKKVIITFKFFQMVLSTTIPQTKTTLIQSKCTIFSRCYSLMNNSMFYFEHFFLISCNQWSILFIFIQTINRYYEKNYVLTYLRFDSSLWKSIKCTVSCCFRDHSKSLRRWRC